MVCLIGIGGSYVDGKHSNVVLQLRNGIANAINIAPRPNHRDSIPIRRRTQYGRSLTGKAFTHPLIAKAIFAISFPATSNDGTARAEASGVVKK